MEDSSWVISSVQGGHQTLGAAQRHGWQQAVEEEQGLGVGWGRRTGGGGGRDWAPHRLCPSCCWNGPFEPSQGSKLLLARGRRCLCSAGGLRQLR